MFSFLGCICTASITLLPATFNLLNTILENGFSEMLSLVHLIQRYFHSLGTGNKGDIRKRLYPKSGILLSYCGGGVMGSMVTGFCVGLRIWRRKSFRCSLSDLILLTRSGRNKRLARLLLRVGREGFDVRAAGSAWGSAAAAAAAGGLGAGVGSLRGVSSVGLLVGSVPSFSTAAMMSS